jgi:hypothetical protein
MTETHVSPGATYFRLIRLFHRAGLAHKVYQVLEHAGRAPVWRTQTVECLQRP